MSQNACAAWLGTRSARRASATVRYSAGVSAVRRRRGRPGEDDVRDHRHAGPGLDQPQHRVHLPALHREPRRRPRPPRRPPASPRAGRSPGAGRPARGAPAPAPSSSPGSTAAFARRRRGHRQPLPQHGRELQPRVEALGRHDTSATSISLRSSDCTSSCDPLSASSRWIAGCRSWKVRSTSASTPMHSDGVAPTRTRPRCSPTSSATAVRADSMSASMRRASGSTASPAGGEDDSARRVRCTSGDAQLVLQRLELPAQRGLGHPQRVGGASEAAHVRQGDEVRELLECHMI